MSLPAFLTFGADASPMDSGPSSWRDILTTSDAKASILKPNTTQHAAWEEWWETANRLRRRRNGRTGARGD